MIPNFLSILLILLYARAVECQPCTDCDPDIPSRLSPTEWYWQNAHSKQLCQAGQYLESENQCKQCPVGTFMTSAMAKIGRFVFCTPCLKVSDSAVEKVIAECNSTRDTEIHCRGYNYRDILASSCQRCTICGIGSQVFTNFELHPCGPYNDVVCCHSDVYSDCVRPTNTAASTGTPSGEKIEQKTTNNSNPAKATTVSQSTVLQVGENTNIKPITTTFGTSTPSGENVEQNTTNSNSALYLTKKNTWLH